MNSVRQHEHPKTWFRSERVFLSTHEWYFHTREGVDIGPYHSQQEAEIEAEMLKELLRSIDEQHSSLQTIREFVLESYAMGRPLTPNFARSLASLKASELDPSKKPPS